MFSSCDCIDRKVLLRCEYLGDMQEAVPRTEMKFRSVLSPCSMLPSVALVTGWPLDPISSGLAKGLVIGWGVGSGVGTESAGVVGMSH